MMRRIQETATRFFAVIWTFVFACMGWAALSAAQSEGNTIRIYLDADRTHHVESADSMEMGIRVALDEIDNMVQGRRIELVPVDHRGNVARSKRHMDLFLKDQDALVFFGGMHSPPYIKHREFINKNRLLTLVPWAAGGPITRYPSDENWVFRLSVDDTKAGYRISQFASDDLGCKSPHLLLEKTPWGTSNEQNMSKAIKLKLGKRPDVTWFNWNTKENGARIKLRNIVSAGADCVLLVANAIEGAVFSDAMLSLETNKRIPIVSHWGITGGKFPFVINAEKRSGLDLFFIQSCFSFVTSEQHDQAQRVFSRLKALFPSIDSAVDLQAPTGFIHAYDLTRILIQALSQVSLGNNMAENRTALKEALENLEQPVPGLIKTYDKPFSVFSETNADAHEALGLEDFCMARFGEENEVRVMDNKGGS